MLLLCGKSCAGKDTVQKELIKMGMKSIVSYTVIDDIDYFVHSEAEIDVLKEDTESTTIESEDEDDTQYKALLDIDKEHEMVRLTGKLSRQKVLTLLLFAVVIEALRLAG